MPHRLTYLIPILCSFLLSSCQKEECTDIVLDQQLLDEASTDFQTWLAPSAFIFKDSLGQEYRYDLSTDFVTIRPNTIKVQCGTDTLSVLYNSEYYLRRFTHTNNTSIVYVHTVVFPEDEQDYREKNLIDKLVLSVFNDNVLSPVPISRIYLITSNKHSGIDQQTFNEMYSVFHQNLTILGKTFQSVYEQSPGFPKMYYAKNEGILSFTDNSGNQLVLDRVE